MIILLNVHTCIHVVDPRLCATSVTYVKSFMPLLGPACIVVPLLKDTLERTPLYNGHKFWAASTVNAGQVLPLTKGHLSNKDRFFGKRGVLIRGKALQHLAAW